MKNIKNIFKKMNKEENETTKDETTNPETNTGQTKEQKPVEETPIVDEKEKEIADLKTKMAGANDKLAASKTVAAVRNHPIGFNPFLLRRRWGQFMIAARQRARLPGARSYPASQLRTG